MAVPRTHGLSLGQKKIIHMRSMTLLWQNKAILVPDNAIFNLFLTVLIFCLFSSKQKLVDIRRKRFCNPQLERSPGGELRARSQPVTAWTD